MARIPLVAPDSATPEQGAVFEEVARQRGGVGNLFRALAHSPEAARRVGALGAYLRFEAQLPDRLREAVILAVSGCWHCPYEQAQHRPLAARLGLGLETIDRLCAGERPEDLSAPETAAVDYAIALCRDGRVQAATAESLRAALGERGLVNLTVLVGYYTLLALFLNALEVAPEAVPPRPTV